MKPSRSFGGIVDTYQKYHAILQQGLAYKFGSNTLGIAEVNRATLFVFTLWNQIKAVKRKNSWRNYSNIFSLFQVLENNLETLFDLFYALNNNIDNVKLLNPSFYKSVILLLSLVKSLRKKTINKNDFPNDDSNKQNKEEYNQEGYNQEEYNQDECNQEEYNQDEYNYWNRNSHKNQFSQDFFSELKELNDVNSLTFTGIIYERDGKIEEAIDCYNRAIKLKQKLGNNTNDDDYEAKVRLLNILTMRKEFDKIEIKEIQFFEEIYTKFKEVKHPEAMGDQISSMKNFNLPIIENILNEFEFHLGFNE
ncbi:hypothetical protein TRFO_34251 [Tritrichomonas foetus]|uniref:Uncharacterized protein n=1 Tax=Tritrichomonas foetus TaxID=1144522 RepID=A0A1J4JJK2_9EUKA|nr:hypothetical protein TRFO_34251 [Tritrichomonas foetus]|eukprot:OHS99342.1 hypothetical protein TRFO_34251 [Tritrichomonas foetus]